MKKRFMKTLALLLSAAMIISLTACGGSSAGSQGSEAASKAESSAPAAEAQSAAAEAAPAAEAEAPAAEAQSTAAEAAPAAEEEAAPAEAPAEGQTYKLSYNVLGAGVVWMLDKYAQEVEYFGKEVLGCDVQMPSANFSADQMRTDCQNLIQSGIQGHVYYGAFDTLTPTISDLFKDAQIPFSMPDQLPSEDSLAVLMDNPYFAGAVGGDYYSYGYEIGKAMAEDGCKNVLLVRGAYGDTSQDGYADGLEAAMKEAGGQVLGAAVCASPDEAMQKSQDLIAAYGAQADGVFAINKTYADAVVPALQNYGYSIPIYSDNIDYTAEDMVKSGEMIAFGGMISFFPLATALVINYLDGHPILDENDKPPVFNHSISFKITADNWDQYEEYWLNDHPLTDEVWQQLLYRYNPDVDYQTWVDFINNCTFDYIVSLHE